MPMSRELTFALLAAFCFGVAPIFEKLGLARTDAAVALFLRAGVTTVLVVIYWLLFPQMGGWTMPDGRSLVYILLGGVFGVLFAQYFYFKALAIGDVGRVMPIVGSFPVLAFLLSALILGEAVTVMKVVGILLVVVGVFLLGE
ncbi:EamA family transporter [Desmospora activa]|uniref:Transporter family protein n=1 Tax=Desmospora activa DSM 45169 TaxID=1121389 RepID=A0A2T4ZDJ3_9BACL|nr:EamA family transporter [Desmospora activa]PTM59968.1 transporter family protein [Desmospora activa DSM 45169]